MIYEKWKFQKWDRLRDGKAEKYEIIYLLL